MAVSGRALRRSQSGTGRGLNDALCTPDTPMPADTASEDAHGSRWQVSVCVPSPRSLPPTKPPSGRPPSPKPRPTPAKPDKAAVAAIQPKSFSPDDADILTRSAGRQRSSGQRSAQHASAHASRQTPCSSASRAARSSSPARTAPASRPGATSAGPARGAALPVSRQAFSADAARLGALVHPTEGAWADPLGESSSQASPAAGGEDGWRSAQVYRDGDEPQQARRRGHGSPAVAADSPLPSSLPPGAQRARVNGSPRRLSGGGSIHDWDGGFREPAPAPSSPQVWRRESSARRDANMRALPHGSPSPRGGNGLGATPLLPAHEPPAHWPALETPGHGDLRMEAHEPGQSYFRSETLRFAVAVAEELDRAEEEANGRPTVEVARASIRLLGELGRILPSSVSPVASRLFHALSLCLFSPEHDGIATMIAGPASRLSPRAPPQPSLAPPHCAMPDYQRSPPPCTAQAGLAPFHNPTAAIPVSSPGHGDPSRRLPPSHAGRAPPQHSNAAPLTPACPDVSLRLPYFAVADRLEDSIRALRNEHAAVSRRLDAQAEECGVMQEAIDAARVQLRQKTAAIDNLIQEQAAMRESLEKTRELAAKWELRYEVLMAESVELNREWMQALEEVRAAHRANDELKTALVCAENSAAVLENANTRRAVGTVRNLTLGKSHARGLVKGGGGIEVERG